MNNSNYQLQSLHLYKGGKTLLDQISCTIPSGSLTVVIGPNGAGKTSLLRCLAGLEHNYKGSLSLLGKELRAYSQSARTKTLSWCPANTTCAFPYSVLEVVCMGRFAYHEGYPSTTDYQLAYKAIEQMKIEHLTQLKIHTLSSGEFRKVMIAQALASQNRILVLDEPDAHLDLACTFATLELLKSLCRNGRSVCISLHDLHLAQTYADHLLVLKGGRLLSEGDRTQTFQESLVREAFGVQMLSVKTTQNEIIQFLPEVETLSD